MGVKQTDGKARLRYGLFETLFLKTCSYGLQL